MVEKYQIIPRRFRPKTFSEVAGHGAIVTTLKNALSYKKMGQAYLFCGARGCGKTTLARLFAKALNCTNISDNHEPCNVCTSCTEISEGCNLDITEIDGASNRGIDDIRQLNETVAYATHGGHYKIYIIDEVHMLTKEAFNALLKTLEEPPDHVKFFFATTEPHRIPQTIISRCQRFNLSRIPEKELVTKLQRIASVLNIDVEEAALVQIGRLAEGSLRDAESLFDQLICYGKSPITLELTREIFGLISSHHLLDLDEAILSQNIDKAIEIGRNLYETGRDIGAAIDSLLEHYRNHLQQNLKSSFTKAQCLIFLETLIKWQQQMLKTPFKQIHLEMLLIALVKSAKSISLDSLIQRLLELESQVEPDRQRQSKNTSSESPVATFSNPSSIAKEAVKPAAVIEETPTESIKQPSQVPEPVKSKEEVKPAAVIKETPTESIKQPSQVPEPVKAKEEVKQAPAGAKAPSEIKQETKPPSEKTSEHPVSKYDTLIRFAAVELEGSIKN